MTDKLISIVYKLRPAQTYERTPVRRNFDHLNIFQPKSSHSTNLLHSAEVRFCQFLFQRIYY